MSRASNQSLPRRPVPAVPESPPARKSFNPFRGGDGACSAGRDSDLVKLTKNQNSKFIKFVPIFPPQ